jgi:hypothetical protein
MLSCARPHLRKSFPRHVERAHTTMQNSIDRTIVHQRSIASRCTLLQTAAILYAKESSATSAHLQNRSHDLSDAARPDEEGSACRACGIITSPGQNEHIAVESRRPKLQTGNDEKLRKVLPTETYLIRTCHICGYHSKQLVPKKRKAKKHTQAMALQQPRETLTSSESSKRKKRNKAKGLQAMLAKADSSAKSSSSGLDFLDLMRA